MKKVESRVEAGGMDQSADAELGKLQRQYRMMEENRKTFSEESKNTIRKQKARLVKLQQEKEEINKSLKVAQSNKHILADKKNMKELKRLLDEEDYYQRLIDEENKSIKKLDDEILQLENEIHLQNKIIGGKTGAEQQQAVDRQIRMLENRLEKATINYDKMLASNSKLRKEIDHLRIQRSVFDGLHKKIVKQLNDQKRTMGLIIEQSNQAYNQRDDAQAKIQALKEKNEKDLQQYNLEYKELMRIIDHDAKLKDFMSKKSQERCEVEEQQTAKRRAGQTVQAENNASDMIAMYQKAFTKIKEITGESDMNVLMRRFVETEDKNFALFNYINELNRELEVTQKQIETTRNSIREFNEEGVRYQSERFKVLQEVEKELEESTKEASLYKNQLEITEKMLSDLRQGIESVFTAINCNPEDTESSLEANQSLTNDNMLKYLGVIEHKTNQLLQVHTYLQLKELESKPEGNEFALGSTVMLGGPNAPPHTKPIQISIPVLEDYKEEDPENPEETVDINKPLGSKEMLEIAMKNALKREQGTHLSKRNDKSPHDKPSKTDLKK